MNSNPLSAYFRQPSIYVNLPSQGYWWPEGSIVMPAHNELSVMSMTAGDEIALKTPDALFSGEATVSMIQNCMPGIKNAWLMPIVDLETVLIVIRIASVGHILNIEATCPSCKESSNYEIDLRDQLSQFEVEQWKNPIQVGPMLLYFQPLNYNQLIQYQNKIFQNQKQLKNLSQTNDISDKDEMINKIINDINVIELDSYCACVKAVQINDVIVTDSQHINEFLTNCEKRTFSKIKEHIDQLRESARCNDLKLMCNTCNYQFSSTFSMDYTSFFDLGS